ncbi:hypothetical protein BTH42_05505 [Burkholderia sp. SRS-W-2-2016]|uniref:Csu type fimbrial protein n=1 Tax=Burkholderia sp. SRS-W-2-2016 TaxID=1926878 RepID=UPI00094AD894|nr:spore coat U domain-containing protein [Burkholderia sp. SRS-W-2-2016]OLL32684.1 hypothetical protein BTH42_05505 [Burkholderia sp. SRS-W-2-2016]
MRIAKFLAVAAAASFVAMPFGAAHAAITGQIQVQLNVSSGCQVSSGSSVQSGANINDFGTLDFGSTSPTWTNALSAEVTGSSSPAGALQVTCDPGVSQFTVAIDGGLRNTRTMQLDAGTDTVDYSVYQDVARTTEYPVNTPVTYQVPSEGTAVTVPIYGAIAPNATAKTAGAYNDTLTVTLDF